MDEPFATDFIKPLPKSHLFLNKLRRINSIDRDIRKKWSKMQQEKIQAVQRNFKELIDVQKIRHLEDSAEKGENAVSESFAYRVNKIRSQILREETHLRKKVYDNVYFKKKTQSFKPKLNPFIKESKQIQVTPRRKIKTEQSPESPLMLQKRDSKKEREFRIIENNYARGLKEINIKSRLSASKYVEDQKQWLRKINDKKCYFKIISTWQPPDD